MLSALLYVLIGASFSGCHSQAPILPLLEHVQFPAHEPVHSHALSLPAGVGALLRIDQNDAETRVTIRTNHGAYWLGRIHQLRSVPLIHVVPPAPSPQTIDLQIEVLQSNRFAQVSLTAREIQADIDQLEDLTQALHLYSDAIADPSGSQANDWNQRIENLNTAAGVFEGLGFQEEQLYAELIAAYFTYFYRYDYPPAATQSQKVASRARALELWNVWLQAKIVHAWALVEIAAGNNEGDAAAMHAQVQAAFDEIEAHSARAHKTRERAMSVNGKGVDYFYQARYQDAKAHYQSALELATSIGDQQLEIQIRGNLALAEEGLGDYVSALEELEAVRRTLMDRPGSVATPRIINNLSELGRLYRHIFDFSEAITVLNEALTLSQNNADVEAGARISVALAWAYHEMGHADRALATAQVALPLLEESNYTRGLREIHHIRANIYRHRGEFEQMAQSRREHGSLLMNEANTASFLYESAQDLIATGAPGGDILAALNKALQAAEALQRKDWATTLLIQLCASQFSDSETEDERCHKDRLENALNELLRTGLPRWQLLAREHWVNHLIALGHRSEAIEVLEQMLQEMIVYRNELPGILGAWYWENRDSVLDQYIQLAVDRDIRSTDASRSFALFNRVRNMELRLPGGAGDSGTESSRTALSQRLRALYVRRSVSTSETDLEGIEREIDAAMLQLRQQASPSIPALADDGLRETLRALPAGAILIAHYFAPDGVIAWRADQNGVEVRRLPDSEILERDLEQLSEDMRMVGQDPLEERLEGAGSRLFGELDVRSSETLYVLPTGPLFRFPIDALRLDGVYLGERHQIVSLMSVFGGKSVLELTERAFTPEFVFVAGNPLSSSGNPQLGSAENELEAVARQFTSAQVSVVQGQNFTRDALQSRAFEQAELIHIASHATNDLAYPALSSIALSSQSGSPETFAALDVQALSLSAGLVVLSACESSGSSRFRLDGNLGFVTAFLGQGADSVVASLWPISDRKTAEFMNSFYAELALDGSPARALQRAKQLAISNDKPLRDWAVFQIYLN